MISSNTQPKIVNSLNKLETILDDLCNESLFIRSSVQKKLCLASQEIVGIEIFGRLVDTKNNIYSPAQFIPEMKKQGLMDYFAKSLITNVLDKWVHNPKLNMRLSVAFNLDITNLNEEFTSFLIEIRKQLPSDSVIILDIEYTPLSMASATSLTLLKKLCSAGYQLALELDSQIDTIEDVINSFPVTELKLKRSLFSSSLSNNNVWKQITLVVSTLAKYNIPVTVVGVETDEQYQKVLHSGITNIQGFYIGKSQSDDEIYADLNNTFSEQTEALVRNRVICFSNNRFLAKEIDNLNSTRFDKHIYPLDITVTSSLDLIDSDIVLFDLQSLSELEVAQTLNHKFGNHLYSLLLVPPLENTNDRVKLREVGSFDILEKPLAPLELLNKLEKITTYIRHYQELEEKYKESQNTALISMTDANHYAQIIHFMSDISKCRNLDSLAKYFFSFMENLNLRTSLFITDGTNKTAYCSGGTTCPSTEYKVYQLLHNQAKLHEFGNRLVVNAKNVSFIIKNLPVDQFYRGQLRDYMSILSECLQKIVSSIYSHQTRDIHIEQLSKQSFASVENLKQARQARHAILNSITDSITESFHSLQLSLEQEEFLSHLVSQTLKQNEQQDEDDLKKLIIIEQQLASIHHLRQEDNPKSGHDYFSSYSEAVND